MVMKFGPKGLLIMFGYNEFVLLTKGAEQAIRSEDLTEERDVGGELVFFTGTLNVFRNNYVLSCVGERIRQRRRKDGYSEPVDNESNRVLFISLVKSDGVAISISSASHEGLPVMFVCVSSGSAFGVFLASVGGASGLSCFCCSLASLSSVPFASSTPEDSGELGDTAA